MNKLRTHAPFGNSPTRLKDVKTFACASCYGTGFDVMGKPCSCKHLYIESDNLGTQVVNEQSYVTRITSLESHNRELLAVNQVLREALQKISDMDYGEPDRTKKCKHDKYHWEECEQCIIEVADEALALKPGDIALVEVGYASEPSIRNLINGNDVIVGKKNEIRTEAVYALQKERR